MSAPSKNLRRRLAPILGIGLLVTLGFVVFGGPAAIQDSLDEAQQQPWERDDYRNSGVLGDVDGDGKVSANEQGALDVTEATVNQVVLGSEERPGMAATKGSDSVLVTPAGDDWWSFVADQAADLTFWDAPVPADVEWYALTEGRAFAPGSDRLTRYSALHMVFTSPDQARSWLRDNFATGAASNVLQEVRGRVLTVTPNWVTVNDEPYGPVDELAASRAQVKVGYWRVDYAERLKNDLTEVADAEAYRKFWGHLGIGTGTWTATSPAPDQAWVGALSGFDPAAIDIAEALGEVNQSIYLCEDKTHDCRDSTGISEAIGEMWVADASGSTAGEEAYRPTQFTDGLPDDVALAFTYSGALRGAMNGTLSRNSGSIEKYDTWITDGGMMTVRPVFRAAGGA